MRRFLNFPAALVALGSFLEVYYYVARFIADGAPLWLAIVEGCALTLLLQFVVFFGISRSRGWFALAGLLVLYSVFSTASGQQLSHADVLAGLEVVDAQEAARAATVAALEAEASRLQVEIDAIVIPSEIGERAKWRTAVAAAEARRDELRGMRAEVDARLGALRAAAIGTDSGTGRDSYHWYAGLFGGDPRFFQLFFQFVLSVLVSIMAPIGVLAFPRQEREDAISVGSAPGVDPASLIISRENLHNL